MASWRTVHLLVDMWNRVLGAQPAPPRLLVAVTAAVALAVVLPYQPWKLARHVITIAHEGGHALVALLTGRRLAGVRLHSDTSGLTVSSGRPSGPGMVLTLLAGYVTPSLLGLGWAAVLATGRITLLLWTSLVVLAAMLVMIRNAFGVVSVVVTGTAVFVVSWYASPAVQAGFAYLAVWFLLAGGVRPVFELQRLRRRGGMRDSDADQVARLTRVPGLVWVGVFLAVNVLALVAGTWLTLRGAGIGVPDVTLPG